MDPLPIDRRGDGASILEQEMREGVGKATLGLVALFALNSCSPSTTAYVGADNHPPGECEFLGSFDDAFIANVGDVLSLSPTNNVNDYIHCRLTYVAYPFSDHAEVYVSESDAQGHDFVAVGSAVGSLPAALVIDLSR